MLREALQHIFPDILFDDVCIDYVEGREVITSWKYAITQPTQAEIDAAILPAAKSAKLALIRAEAKSRIESQYPQWRQLDAALGILPTAYVEQMRVDIAAVIEASNTAEDAIDSAASIEAVNAVEVVWP